MKLYGALCIIIAIIMLLTPIVSLSPPKTYREESSESITDADKISEQATKKVISADRNDDDTISVFMTSDSSTESMEMRDYIIGVVAAEVPASYETEAIKAQALVAVTYAEYRKLYGSDEDIGGADVSDDSSRHQGYMTTEAMQEKWDDAYETYYDKIASAVDDVIDEVIIYKNEPIMAAYHAISPGQTDSAENMWGKDIAYLQSVTSEWDKDSTRYSSEVALTAKELKDILKETDGTDFSTDEEEWIKIKKTSGAGTVLEAEICGVTMTGMEIRNMLSLRSPTFTVEYNNGEFIFSVSGYGHGVGMSQNGANCMAQEGKTYEEIIAHYYPETVIEERKQ